MTTARSALPANVRRWLDRSLPSETRIPKRIINTQEGEIHVRDKWMPFTAETVYERDPFTFVWRARLKMLPGMWVVAEDGHDGEKGWGGSKLWGIISMGSRTDPELFRMQLIRSLAELPWIPQFALAIPGLEWKDTSDTSFEVRTVVGNQEVSVSFKLNGDNEITQASSKRHYDVPDGFVEVPWRVDYSDYREFGSLRIPASAVATYEKSDGQWVYWKGKILLPQETAG